MNEVIKDIFNSLGLGINGQFNKGQFIEYIKRLLPRFNVSQDNNTLTLTWMDSIVKIHYEIDKNNIIQDINIE